MKYLIQFIAIPILYIPVEYFLEGDLEGYSIIKNVVISLLITFGTYCQDFYMNENEEIETS